MSHVRHLRCIYDTFVIHDLLYLYGTYVAYMTHVLHMLYMYHVYFRCRICDTHISPNNKNGVGYATSFLFLIISGLFIGIIWNTIGQAISVHKRPSPPICPAQKQPQQLRGAYGNYNVCSPLQLRFVIFHFNPKGRFIFKNRCFWPFFFGFNRR